MVQSFDAYLAWLEARFQEIVVLLNGDKLLEYLGEMGAHQGGFGVTGWSIAPLVDDAGQDLPLLSAPLPSRFSPPARPLFP